MSWKDLICLCVIVVGVILFLYGSNYYDAFAGWAGIYLVFGGIVAFMILKAYEFLMKKGR